jgi:drug/metabolite transporter (DMT)-like permease
VLVWGLTSILGKLITLPSLDVVIWRTGIAAVGSLALARWLGVSLAMTARERWHLIAVGGVIGLHWVLFFASARIATASVCLAAMPTIMVWCTIIEPLVDGTRRWNLGELLLGVVMVGAVWLIYSFEFSHAWGFTVGLASALLAALFGVANKSLALRHHYAPLLVWQMIGACAVCLLALPLVEGRWLAQMPGARDTGWLLLLGLLCTVGAYAGYIDVLRRLSVFTINVIYNLEPVYGIILATLIFGDGEVMSTGFYFGTAIIIASVVALPFMQRSGGVSHGG